MKVFINPGHSPNGILDPGAGNILFHLYEHEIARHIGELLKAYLILAGCEVCLLQSHNLNGEAKGENVVKTANDWQADVFVSIHLNAADGTARGAETLVYDLAGEGAVLGLFIQDQLAAALQQHDSKFPDRGIKPCPELIVLKATAMPAVLVECAFIDNTEDMILLLNHKQETAAAIARGVTDYWQKISE